MYKVRQALARFMAGRRGMDELGIAMYIAALVMYIAARIAGSYIVNLLATALWAYGIFRSLSRNIYKRSKENEWFLSKYRPVRTEIAQAVVRFKNRKIYKYYRCPKCRSRLKLPRHVGEKTVTCGKCGAVFKKKA